ncbi:MAG: DUF1588 domain-containing protein [Prosthecobacter sp.]|uniref:DUF1588 domain-containing protein n=1 Tax=Prosthecobacter sp. TaxID=1965333 RepID=UPI003902CD8F
MVASRRRAAIHASRLHRIKVSHATSKRRLLSSLAQILSSIKKSANGTNTSPVVRGAWVVERLIGQPPPPPPPSVPTVEPDIRGAKTIRDLMALKIHEHGDADGTRKCVSRRNFGCNVSRDSRRRCTSPVVQSSYAASR